MPPNKSRGSAPHNGGARSSSRREGGKGARSTSFVKGADKKGKRGPSSAPKSRGAKPNHPHGAPRKDHPRQGRSPGGRTTATNGGRRDHRGGAGNGPGDDRRGDGAGARVRRSHRTGDVDIHLASKVSHDLRQDISTFKARRSHTELFDASLNELFHFVCPNFVQQHLPEAVEAYRSYRARFQRGAANEVAAFTMWYEWASYELNKGKSFAAKKGHGAPGEQQEEEQEEAAGGGGSRGDHAGDATEKDGRKSKSRQVMAQTIKEREHVRALLQMCLRHNAARRKEGQHALVNHLNSRLAEADCGSLERLRGTAHHSVAYALSRLLLGMATDDFAMVVLHCHALYLVLTSTPITPSVVLALLDEELAMSARMNAAKLRLSAKHAHAERDELQEDADVADAFDPDDINDPTKGERNQRLTAAVFALAAVVAAEKHGTVTCTPADAAQVSTFLSFCYVHAKATRVLSANALFLHVRAHPELLSSEEVMTWATFAFFHFSKMEYFRPEAIQFLVRLMTWERKEEMALSCLPATVVQYLGADPLEPTTLERLVNALFRKEQVTLVHPMVHPIWDDLFALILQRCAMGESLKEHLSAFVHGVIAPYRRGSADVPRRALFQSLVTRLGQLAVQSEDSAERVELLHMASTNAGYGARTAAKPTPLVDLRRMPIHALTAKVDDLLQQYRSTKDRDPAAHTNRTWVLRELRNCLYVPMPSSVVQCPYVDTAVMALLEQGFFPPASSKDDKSKNRCIYLFSEVFSFTYEAAKARPRSTVTGRSVLTAYLEAEEKGLTRFTTARSHKKFLKARNRIVEALETAEERSVLFYDLRDAEILLTLLFLILSVDDPSNSEAVALATSTVPDLVQFFRAGDLESLDLFFDVLMSLIMRVSSPLQVMPLMTCVRRIAIGYALKFAPHIKGKSTLDIVLSPLREAYHTDSRELARLRKAKEGEAAYGASDSDADDGDHEEEGEEEEEHSAKRDASEGEGDDDDDDSSSSSSSQDTSDASSTATSTAASEGEEGEADDRATDVSSETATDEDGHRGEEEDDALLLGEGEDGEDGEEEEEAPTQHFLEALKGMVGNVDLDHAYPVDTANKEKSDAVRAVHLVGRIGVSLVSPLVAHVYQVLLAVARETVKSSDDEVFNAALSALELLFLGKNRYYGYFLPATDLFQLLGDIQSYCRKRERTLFARENVSAKAASIARRRLQSLKAASLRVIHFLAMLAYKNHAGEDVRITIGEFYKSLFCDRGWDMKQLLPGLKKDLYHYRQGFAWALLPAAFEKFGDIAELAGAQRVRVFAGCCTMVECMLSRLSGLPAELKQSAGKAIREFLQSFTVGRVNDMKHTLPHTFLHAVKMAVQYNSRVHLDTAWVAEEVVAKSIDDDSIQLSAASVRLLASLERLLGLTHRAKETKPPVPVKVLFQQFEKTGAKEKGEFYRKSKRAREKVVKALLAYRNKEPTDDERAAKRRRREELKVEDRLQRQVMRESRTTVLTKEEREEKRKKILMAKQERIAKNRERKRRLHEARQRAFDRWRQAKIAAAAAAAAEEEEEGQN